MANLIKKSPVFLVIFMAILVLVSCMKAAPSPVANPPIDSNSADSETASPEASSYDPQPEIVLNPPFALDFDAEEWGIEENDYGFSGLRSQNLSSCRFQELLGSGNGPYGERYELNINGKAFYYYLNDLPGQVEFERKEILVYHEDPSRTENNFWAFQVFAKPDEIEDCFELVKDLLKNFEPK